MLTCAPFPPPSALAASLLALPLLPRPALAKNAKEAAAAAAARKEALRKAAADVKSTGRDENVFADSPYAVGEDHSPNAHSHQDEGAKTAGGG